MVALIGVAERVHYPVTVELGGGLLVYIANSCDQVIYDDIFRDHEYGLALDRLARLRPELLGRYRRGENPVIVDLGMNMGYFTLYCMTRLSPVNIWGIEAVPEIAREASRRIGNHPNVHILTGVVGKRSGSVGVEISLSHPCNRIVNGARPMAPDTTQVRLLKYIDLLSLDLPEHIDLLKCDIEGAEEQFCESYPELLKRCDAVVMEMHPKLCDMNACLEALIGAGFNSYSMLARKPETSLQLFTRGPAC